MLGAWDTVWVPENLGVNCPISATEAFTPYFLQMGYPILFVEVDAVNMVRKRIVTYYLDFESVDELIALLNTYMYSRVIKLKSYQIQYSKSIKELI